MTQNGNPAANSSPALGPSHRWWQKWVAAALLAALFAGSALVALRTHYQDDFLASHLAQEQVVLQELSIVRAQLESYLNGDLYQVKGLIGLPIANQRVNEKQFARIAAELAGNDQQIMSLQLAPNGIVTHVWPYEQNKGAIGHDLLADPQRRVAANRAIESRQLWVAGPVELIQGGVAIIGRYPIFVDDTESAGERFWGFATVLIDWSSVVARARQAVGATSGIEIAIRGKDGLGAAGEQLYGQPEVFTDSPITMDVVLPGGVWQLAGVPAQGWITFADHKVEQRLLLHVVVILLALGFYALLRLPVRLRRMVEEATFNLRQSENRLVDAIEAIPDAFAIFDASDRLVLCNANFRRVYQRSEAAIEPGATASSLIEYGIAHGQYAAGEGDQALSELLRSKLELHGKAESHYEEHLSDGRVLRVIQRRMRDGGLAGIRVDISDLKRKEHELVEAKRQADASNEAKNTFLATVSHELRTPLNVVIGVLTALQSSTRLGEVEQERVKVANRSGKHLLALVNEILDLSRVESGKLELQHSAFDFAGLINPALDFARSGCEQKDLQFLYEEGPGVPRHCRGDSVRVRQVLFNLLSNAIKFTPSGTVRLTVEASAPTDGRTALTFCVDDSGPGVAESMKPLLYKAFAQGDASLVRQHGGAGLGLALSKRLARLMGGDIEAGDSPLGGARFTLSLTLECVSGESGAMAEQRLSREPVSHSPRRVLTVDDSPTNQLVIECLLDGTGYELHCADGGAQAIERVQEQAFDLILMDISMPEMDGVEATRRIRELLGEACPVVVAVTAHSMAGDREYYLTRGMDGFITKPIDKQELIRTIEAAGA
ncbi:response regulator [Pseudomonas sp. LPB0260]|uniref:response regulator n=1 Tax=Pseudomonas sp. LPB0260 TaxID=2614442 RepID=UPI0015C1D545|nr:response regulator [Pseudomonas sp. LPB0260]QLC74461.1 response regulator [Pseudomonas sp. LPB0260]QLC77231.1 response regulator [Pseudomonas sp. LPB0260]